MKGLERREMKNIKISTREISNNIKENNKLNGFKKVRKKNGAELPREQDSVIKGKGFVWIK